MAGRQASRGTGTWVLAGGTATVLKLAHDEAARSRSPGTVLTAAMIRGLLRA